TKTYHDMENNPQRQHHAQLDPVVGVNVLVHADSAEHISTRTDDDGDHNQHQFGNAQWLFDDLVLIHYGFPPIAPAVAPAIEAEADTPFSAIGMSVSSGWSLGDTGGASGINAVSKSTRIS